MAQLLSRDELQPDLRSVRRLNDFFAAKDVALCLRHSQRLTFFVVLVHFAQPLVAVTDAPVVLAQDRLVTAVFPADEPNVVGGAVQLRAPDNDVRRFPPFVAVVANERGALGVHFDSVAHRRKTLDEVPLFTHNSRELTVG